MLNYVLIYLIIGFIVYLLSDMKFRAEQGHSLSFAAGGFIWLLWPVLIYMIAFYAITGKTPSDD